MFADVVIYSVGYTRRLCERRPWHHAFAAFGSRLHCARVIERHLLRARQHTGAVLHARNGRLLEVEWFRM